MAARFPKVIHVVREEPTADESYLSIHESGVNAIDEDGTPVAVYQLVEVGQVSVSRQFVPIRNRRRRG